MKPGAKIARLGSLRLGTVVAIPLPDRRLAYARLYRGSVGIYFCEKGPALTVEDLVGLVPRAWFNYCSMPGARYKRDWLYLGEIPFAREDDAWPPPMSATDAIATKPRLYWKGEFLNVTEDELVGKQKCTFHGFVGLKDEIANDATLRSR